ncbi:MAG: IS3 family transposase [Clostridiales bacterium]|nr:IS3 family transposase [Clostridiales bacterium]MBR2549625.1 IS3 family transposase [Clostridiales bacterium]
MKYSFELKKEIYEKYCEGYGGQTLSIMYGLSKSRINYMCRLIDLHGLDAIRHKRTKYSNEYKLAAIKRVLENGEPAEAVAVNIGLANRSVLDHWIKSYIKNGYNVVTQKKGRHSTRDKEKEDGRGAGEGERRTSRATVEEDYRERIIKKTASLSSRGRKEEKEQLTEAVTELRQELKCSLDFILETINSNDSLPNLPRSDYYYWKNRIDPDTKNSDLMDAIAIIYANNHKRYGYRRITLQLKNEGWTVNHKTVKRLMSKLELYGVTPRTKYKSYKGDFNGTVDNKLLYKKIDTNKHRTEYIRDFSTSGVNEKWTTDVSEFHISAGKLYLSPILDMHNREIVSYNISRSPCYVQIKDMLDKAFDRFDDLNNLIFHSDQGWQYQMLQYHKALKKRGITQSMSRKGNCLDNSPMENFFGKMKNEMFYGHEYEFKTLEQLQKAMEEYIEYYNNERIQVKLKGLTPCQARNQSLYSF